jgi:D-glycero-alpha-D-manno-heptose-7-phosphate kinase
VNPTRIVRARVPLRLGLAGGGTDLSPYCDQYGGAVLNVTIDRYAYAFIEPVNDGRLHFATPDLEAEEGLPLDLAALETAKLQLHAGVTRRMLRQFGNGVVPSVRVVSYVDAPPGSGLGSSSAWWSPWWRPSLISCGRRWVRTTWPIWRSRWNALNSA